MKAPAPRTLESWWHKAVFVQKGDICMWPTCNRRATDAHHYVHKRYGLLKYDVQNGIPLCRKHHDEADREYGREVLRECVNMSYLVDIQQTWRTVKDYLTKNNLTREEFLRDELMRLKEVVKYGR